MGHSFRLHIPEPLFWVVMLLIAGVVWSLSPDQSRRRAELAESRDLLESSGRIE